jgi:methionyl-tRNA formyltransferase
MTDTLPRIVFMGSPPFAVASLRALHEGGYPVVTVITAPDKPAGRGRKITPTAVRQYADEHQLPLMQPERLRDPAFILGLRELKADIFVVVAYRILPEEVWSVPPMGTVNLHASILPQYRGAAPINHAIINGETKTGVTTFLIDKDIDTGKILITRETDIRPDDNAGSLHDRLMTLGAGVVIETVKGLYEGKLKAVPQRAEPGAILHTAPRIFPADTIINWHEPAMRIHNKIRGLAPHPGAVAILRSEKETIRLKIYESVVHDDISVVPGTIIADRRSKLMIASGSGALEVVSLQPEGRKRMTASEFIRGFDLSGWETARE